MPRTKSPASPPGNTGGPWGNQGSFGEQRLVADNLGNLRSLCRHDPFGRALPPSFRELLISGPDVAIATVVRSRGFVLVAEGGVTSGTVIGGGGKLVLDVGDTFSLSKEATGGTAVTVVTSTKAAWLTVADLAMLTAPPAFGDVAAGGLVLPGAGAAAGLSVTQVPGLTSASLLGLALPGR